MVNGSRIIRQRLFKPRDPITAASLLTLQTAYLVHSKKLTAINKELRKESMIGSARKSLNLEFESETLHLKKTKAVYTDFFIKELPIMQL